MASKFRSSLAILAGLAGFAVAFRRSGKGRRKALDSMRPEGRSSKPSLPTELGRNAKTPIDIPPQGWWHIVRRTAQKFLDNEIMSEAASVTFYTLLSLVPALTAMVSIYGLVSDPHTIAKQLDALSAVVPSGGMEIISDQVNRLVEGSHSGLGIGLVVGLSTALWSSNAATKAMFSSLNDVYEEEESRGFVQLTLWSLAFTIGGMLMLLLGVALIVVLPIVFKALGLEGAFALAVRILRLPLMATVMVMALALLYRYGPSRAPPRWRWVTWGGAFGAVAWIGLSVGFSWYVSNFGSYNKTYGSLGAIIGFMTWIWLSATVLLLGAQLNAEMEVQTTRDTTTAPRRPIGERGARAADAVG